MALSLSAAVPPRQLDGPPIAAFEGDRRFLHARRLHQARRCGGEAHEPHFVDVRPDRGRGAIHRFAQIVGGERADELAGLLGVALTVLAAARGEHHEMRILGDGIEETIGREIDDAVLAERRDPADRPRRDQRLERVERKTVRVGDGVVEHGALSGPIAQDARPRRCRRASAAPAPRASPWPCQYRRNRPRARCRQAQALGGCRDYSRTTR